MVYGDGKYAHFLLDLYLCDSNHIVGSITKLLCDLEKPPASSSGLLFKSSGATLLYAAILRGKEACMSGLGSDLVTIPAQKLCPILHVRLDNCWKDNKSLYVFYF